MEKKTAVISCLILIAMVIAVLPRAPITFAANTKAILSPSVTELGPEDAVNATFKVSCVIENTSLLYGVDIQIKWTTESIAYVNHTKMIPRNTYPDGILYSPTINVKDAVDESANMSGSEVGTMYWVSEAAMLPAPTFNDTGVAFDIFFRVKQHPIGVDTDIWVNFTNAVLADRDGFPIARDLTNAHVLLHGRTQPTGPEIDISSATYKGAVPYTFTADVTLENLDAYWDLGGFDLQLSYSPDVLQATSTSIDPDGWFASFWNQTIVIMNDINTPGKVWIAVLGLPLEQGVHTPPSGSARLCTVTFSATGSGPIEKISDDFSLAAFPHPERPEAPFDSQITAVPIPFTVSNGFAHVVGVTQHTPMAGYTVTTESNSSVTAVFFEPGIPLLQFNVSGPSGYMGYVNVTVPRNFIWSDTAPGTWVGLFDGQKITPAITYDNDNTYLYFSYEQTKHSVSIVGQHVVPELGLATMTMFMTLSILAFALTKKLHPGKKR